MINNVLNNRADLITSFAQPVKNTTLTTELQNIAPNVAEELINQFGEETVEQLLQQQLSSLLTVSSQKSVLNYQSQYSAEELALRTVITSQQEGLLNNENSDNLMARLNQSVQNIHSAYANTSDILSSLGQLGHQQKSFLASSEQRVDRAIGAFMEQNNRKSYEDDDNYRFELSVDTKEGDSISITFNSSQGYDESAGETVDGFSLSYQVDGHLSEAEHEALNKVLAGVGEMADEFFKLNETSQNKYVPQGQLGMNLDFLSDFNHQQLSSFDVSFSTTDDQISDSPVNKLDLSYQIDQDSQQQALAFDSEAGQNKIKFTLDMSTFGGQDVKQMQQYLATLDNNLEDSRHNSKDQNDKSAFGRKSDEKMQQGFALFKGAFANMSLAAQQSTNSRTITSDLVDNMVASDPRYQGLNDDTNNTLGTGISTLADFDAQFSFLKESGDRRPQSIVKLNQVTEQEKSGKLTGLTQTKNVSSQFNYQDIRPDNYNKTESYKISTAVKDNELVGLDQHHQVNVDKETYRFNPETNQYQLMMGLTEQITDESKIRLVEDMFLETKEDSHIMNKKDRIADEGKPKDFKRTNKHSHNQLISLIGNLDKLAEDKDLKP